ncbi:Hemin transport protein [Luteimonas aestuarii]|uniref:Hemin transport protein n=1 Tax=Luteimonas aestuarii TaxID=453837 RepID=UPI001A9EA9E1|nr:Hemin transport protein [Luteimonas aestuarii]
MPRLSMPSSHAGGAMCATGLPSPLQLAALGTVLCLYRARSGGELGGWLRAMQAESSATLDSDGMREALVFRDATGACCWQLFLLPDSDFLAWESLSKRLPEQAIASSSRAGLAERMWLRLAGHARDGDWQASVLRLQARGSGDGPLLAATLAAVSPQGAAAARAIARSQHANLDALRDDCCCARAARAAHRDAAHRHDTFPPLVRLHGPDTE